MKTRPVLLSIFCVLDIFLPFFGFFALLDHNWILITTYTSLHSKGWLVAPISILLLVAIVFIYITSVQFPSDQKEGWRLLRGVLISFAMILVSSGTNWQLGLFQYSLLEFVALAAAFGAVLPRQKVLVGWLFGLPALGWSIVATGVSYQLYAATFLFSAPWVEWVVWPIWLLIAIPLVKNRYQLINGFFVDYYKGIEKNIKPPQS